MLFRSDIKVIALDALTYAGNLNSIKEEEGKVTVGFATLTPVEEDGVIAELSFSLNEGEEYGEIRITTADVNDANPGDFETVDVGENRRLTRRMQRELPDTWMKASLQSDLSQSQLYDTSAVPMLYLLDADKRVVLKDADTQKVMAALAGL